ncbi:MULTISPECIES: NAD(P)-binding domain-containing protein [Paenibacillus]|uniref:NAD(P)-binding domain-containing protein n=1 Tax=Paenibacillus TaxID=44249 RepID=UPI0003D39118|nr:MULTISPECIES: NAD(P)-binding domain-containing protein [Paenibacillus]POR28711.1 hypothetical protein CG775_09155 [Paenibacillus polymyxa]
MKKTIGFIGVGNIGSTIARFAVAAGYDVVGDRDVTNRSKRRLITSLFLAWRNQCRH